VSFGVVRAQIPRERLKGQGLPGLGLGLRSMASAVLRDGRGSTTQMGTLHPGIWAAASASHSTSRSVLVLPRTAPNFGRGV